MKQLTVNSFLEYVERSGLVDKSRLSQSLAELEREAGASAVNDSHIVSSHLTQVGLLTDWQRKLLLEGRHNGFFLGKYKLLDHLGTGGMSNVYLAEHPVMRRRVAIKVLPTNRVHDSSYLERFHREARASASLDHPNIVRAFDVDHDGEYHYLVMEYIEGCDLRVLVERKGPLAPRDAAEYIRQAAEGLGNAHQAGLVHRDMKPANLLVDAKGVVKVLDLGLARFADDEADASLTKENDEKMLGTVDYLAPEQALDSHLVDPRADIYSLGGTLYFALTGHPPFPTGSLAQRVIMHQKQEPADILKERPETPPELVAICRKMMAKSPSQRYQTAQEASQALADWLERASAASKFSAAPKFGVRQFSPGRFAPTASNSAAAPSTRPSSGEDEEFRFAPLEEEQARPGRPAAKSGPSSAGAVSSGAASASQSNSASQTNSGASRTKVGGSNSERKAGGSGVAAGKSGPIANPPGASGSKLGGSASQSAAASGKPGPAPAESVPAAKLGAAAKLGETNGELKLQPGDSGASKSAAAKSAASRSAASKPAAGAPNQNATPAAKKPAARAAAQPGSKANAVAAGSQAAGPATSELDAASSLDAGPPLLSGALDDLLASFPETDLAAAPLGGDPLGTSTGLGAVNHPAAKKPAARKGSSLWDSTWFLIGFGTLLALVLIGAVALYRWLFV